MTHSTVLAPIGSAVAIASYVACMYMPVPLTFHFFSPYLALSLSLSLQLAFPLSVLLANVYRRFWFPRVCSLLLLLLVSNALLVFVAAPNELTVHKGDEVNVLKKHPNGWWVCELRVRTVERKEYHYLNDPLSNTCSLVSFSVSCVYDAHSYAHTFTRTFSHTPSRTHTLSLSLACTPSLTLSLSLSYSFPFALTSSLVHTHTHALSLSLSLHQLGASGQHAVELPPQCTGGLQRCLRSLLATASPSASTSPRVRCTAHVWHISHSRQYQWSWYL
jgi:SH3 domain